VAYPSDFFGGSLRISEKSERSTKSH
jgi:hypothetical protein